jgi:hypothetical protein
VGTSSDVSEPSAIIPSAIIPSAIVAAGLGKLPPFGAAALKLLQVSWDDDSPAEGPEEVFKSDPALTAELLLLSNSAFYGRRTQVQSIRGAIKVLGLERVRSLGITIALRSQMGRGARLPYLATVWRTALPRRWRRRRSAKCTGCPACIHSA